MSDAADLSQSSGTMGNVSIMRVVLVSATLAPLGAGFFTLGVPIEIIIFSCLFFAYKWCSRDVSKTSYLFRYIYNRTAQQSPGANSSPAPSPRRRTKIGDNAFPAEEFRESAANDRRYKDQPAADESLSGRGDSGAPPPVDSRAVRGRPLLFARSADSAIQQQRRGIINKLTPENFTKLTAQLMDTLSQGAVMSEVVDDIVALIFEAASRQHQYIDMYTDLCRRIQDRVARISPETDVKRTFWTKCQASFQSQCLHPPVIPAGLDDDEAADRRTKHKHKMVGVVKLGGELVGKGLVPAAGVLNWIHELLTMGTGEQSAAGSEMHLEAACAMLGVMGPSLSDSSKWCAHELKTVTEVFNDLETMSKDAANYSLRIRCLMRDTLELRLAEWKQRANLATAKPTVLTARDEFDKMDVAGRRGNGTVDDWIDPEFIATFAKLDHHVELLETKEDKNNRARKLITLNAVLGSKSVMVIVNSANLRGFVSLFQEHFADVEVSTLEFGHDESERRTSIDAFESGASRVFIVAGEVCTRREFDFSVAPQVLINFDFPATVQLFVYRMHKRAEGGTALYTFLCPASDAKHTIQLCNVLEAVRHKIPDGLLALRDKQLVKNGKLRSDAEECDNWRQGAAPPAAPARSGREAASSTKVMANFTMRSRDEDRRKQRTPKAEMSVT
mmetsp:Transcript_10281/g.22994  ORF Transcript_10281/g.22994 Transcript_10281/m.22994 type:complete len:673 (+) Transcript_10281:159-2177(+)